MTSDVSAAAFPEVNGPSIEVVILAHDEAAILGGTIPPLIRLLGQYDSLHVVADHCRDQTAEIARVNGASTHVRSGGKRGKGPALAWWLERTSSQSKPSNVVVVLDADTKVEADFFRKMRSRFLGGAKVAQARVAPIITSNSPLTRLAALSENMEQMVTERVRAYLGWPARLRGTGMAFRRDVLEAHAPKLETLVEDAELTILLTANRIPIDFLHNTLILDPKPSDQRSAIRQRSRWLRGQAQVLKAHPWAAARLILQGPRGWSLIAGIAAKPKSLFVPLLTGIIISIWAMPPHQFDLALPWVLLPLIAGGIFVINGLALFYVLLSSPDRKATFLALLIAPIYLMMWLRSLASALMLKETWPRVRRVASEQTARKSQLAG